MLALVTGLAFALSACSASDDAGSGATAYETEDGGIVLEDDATVSVDMGEEAGSASYAPSYDSSSGASYDYSYSGSGDADYYGPGTVVRDAAAGDAADGDLYENAPVQVAPSPGVVNEAPMLTVPDQEVEYEVPPTATGPERKTLWDILFPWGQLFGDPGEQPPAPDEAEPYYEDETVYEPYPHWGGDEPRYTDEERREAAERYNEIVEASRIYADEDPQATLALKVSTAAYTNTRRYLEDGQLPPADAVRTEELINYFSYDERAEFIDGSPFSIRTEIGPSPFDESKLMAYVRLRTMTVAEEDLPPSNLVFLIDVSGSMDEYNKLPLLQDAFAMLVDTLGEDDKVSIVVYASDTGVVLEGVSGGAKNRLKSAIYELTAGGSTAGEGGIQLAYQVARENYIDGGNNRVILATDGDFNVGISDVGQLEDFISEKRGTGVYLSVLGFGMGNLRDDVMETLAASGNGNHAYIDSLDTAHKVLVNEMSGTLFTVADDVKAQAVFDPEYVKSYRMIGYEHSELADEDFENDAVDAGEVGLGTDVNMLFEIDLTQAGRERAEGVSLFDVRIRYKDPGEGESKEISVRAARTGDYGARNTSDFTFAVAVAKYGDMLRHPELVGRGDFDTLLQMAKAGAGEDVSGERKAFTELVAQFEDVWKSSRYYY
jgi:Ca-activated chloride channel family protein